MSSMIIRCKGCNAPIGEHVLRCEFCGMMNKAAAQSLEPTPPLEEIEVPEEELLDKFLKTNYC